MGVSGLFSCFLTLLFPVLVRAGKYDNIFIVEFTRTCDTNCLRLVRRAAGQAGCYGCSLESLGHAVGGEDFLKITCTEGGAAKADMIKATLKRQGSPVKCIAQDGPLYIQGFQSNDLDSVTRQEEGLLWNIDEMDGQEKDGKRCELSLQGDSVLVVVMDTGCSVPNTTTHYDQIKCRNYVGDEVNPPCRDKHGHGTHVAGVISSPEHGVAPFVNIACLRVLGDNGRGSFSTFIRAINDVAHFANSTDDPIVINLSLAGSLHPPLDDAVKAAARVGVYIAVAAGNFNRDAQFFSPAATTDNKHIFAVGAHDRQGRRSSFSDFGPLVQLSGPGQNIISDNIQGGTKMLSGTSMAAPHVAAALATLLSDGKEPTLKLLQAKSTVLYPDGVKVHKAKYDCDLVLDEDEDVDENEDGDEDQ